MLSYTCHDSHCNVGRRRRELFYSNWNKRVYVCFSFCRAMLCKRGICRHAVSVCLSVCLSVTFEKSVKTSNRRLSLKFFSPSGSHTKWHHYSFSIPKVMAIFRRGPLYDGGGVGKTRDSEPITWLRRALSRLRPPGVINTMPPGRGKLWYLSLIVSGEVCWWRETTTTCLWQEVSTLHQRQQNNI